MNLNKMPKRYGLAPSIEEPFRWPSVPRSAICLAIVACHFIFPSMARAQADVFEQKIAEYVRNNHILVEVLKTADLRLIYLCKPGGDGWWAYKLVQADVRGATLQLQGTAPYNTYRAGGQGQGQGVYFAHDLGPLDEGQRNPNHQFQPLTMARLSIAARMKDGATITHDLGALPPQTITALSRCLGSSFPRVLHQQVLSGRNRPR